MNKQIRAESLSIFYAENLFRLIIDLENDHDNFFLTYGNFCNFMDMFATPQGRCRHIQGPMRHVRELYVHLRFGISTCRASFSTSAYRHNNLFGRRFGGDETNWTDLLAVNTLVKDMIDSVRAWNSRIKPNTQRRLVHTLWLLALSFSSDPRTFVKVSI